jgi:hypothetical protein
MSKYQLKTVQQIMGLNAEQAENLINLMDKTNDHPDWSEYSDSQFRKHFKSILLAQ